MKPVKIAMVSLTHGHTRKYYQTLLDNEKLDWVASCAADPRACYSSMEEMFEKHPDIEAVVLASANDQHLEEMRECARRGVHILSMKIPTFDMAEYDEMIRLVDQAGIVCQIELEMHYNPVVRRLKELIASGAVGKILSMQATNITLSPVWAFPWQGVPEASYGRRIPLKEGEPRFRGGALCDHPHIFDLIRHLTGSDFERVYSVVAPNLRKELEVEDMILSLLVAHGGAPESSSSRMGSIPETDAGGCDNHRRRGDHCLRLLRTERLPQRRTERPLHGAVHLLRRMDRTR